MLPLFTPRSAQTTVNDLPVEFAASVLTPLASGGYLVAWKTGGDRISVQSFDAAGLPVGDEISTSVSASNGASNITATGLATGGWVLTWLEDRGFSSFLMAEVFGPDGISVSAPSRQFYVDDISWFDTDRQINASVTALPDGGFLMVWQSRADDEPNAIKMRAFNARGEAVDDPQSLGDPEGRNAGPLTVTALAQGGSIAVWRQDGVITGQFISGEGAPVGTDFTIPGPGTGSSVGDPHVTALANGGYVVTWSTFVADETDPNAWGTDFWSARHYAADGTPAGDTFRLPGTSPGVSHREFAALPDGGWIAVWQNANFDFFTAEGPFEILAQQYDALGRAVGSVTMINASDPEISTFFPEVAVLRDGSVAVIWETRVDVSGKLGIQQQVFEGQEVDTPGDIVLVDISETDPVSGPADDQTLTGSSGDDSISGGTGTDTVVYSGSRGAARIEVFNNGIMVSTPDQGTDRLSQIEFLQFDDGIADVSNIGTLIRGSSLHNRIIGTDGEDTLVGGGGDDQLVGRGGNDVLEGGRGNDRYDIEDAGDIIFGEIGYAQGGGIDTVVSSVSYTLPRNVEILRLTGTADINGTGGFAPEAIVGNTGNNVLDGGASYDVITAKAGDDTLIGGLGADSLVGDEGNDVFLFNNVNESRPGQANRDFINGFVHGEDRIDLSAIDANVGTTPNDAFVFVNNAAFSGAAGEVRWFTFGGGNYNIVEADVNGDRVADMQIFVNLTNIMFETDFIL